MSSQNQRSLVISHPPAAPKVAQTPRQPCQPLAIAVKDLIRETPRDGTFFGQHPSCLLTDREIPASERAQVGSRRANPGSTLGQGFAAHSPLLPSNLHSHRRTKTTEARKAIFFLQTAQYCLFPPFPPAVCTCCSHCRAHLPPASCSLCVGRELRGYLLFNTLITADYHCHPSSAAL